MRLLDSRLQSVVDVVPARAGLLCVRAGTASGEEPTSLTSLRAAVVTDVIRRVAGVRRTRVVVVADGTEAEVARTSAERSALNVHPAERSGGPDEPIGLVIDIQVGGPRPGRYRVDVGPVTIDGRSADTAEGWPLSEIAERGLDPLTLRLAFLQTRYRDPVALAWDELATADAALARWRGAVAAWATSPSAAMPADPVSSILLAVEDDLDTPRAMSDVHDLATAESLSDGAKFEAMAYLDRVLGLDLTRRVGTAQR